MIKLALVKLSPASNPDRAFVKATVTGNYVQVTGDALNLAPASWSDPNGLGVVGPTVPPAVTPSPFSENLAGYYCNVLRGATLGAFAVRFFQPGGAELAAGAYPAAILNGELIFEVVF